MLPGKSMVLLRNGVSDLFDLVTCLCLYSVEAIKIRKRIADPLDLLRLAQRVTTDQSKPILDLLPFDASEREALTLVWPDDTAKRLTQIALHREALHIDIRRQIHTYNSRRTDLWTQQISGATFELLGCDPGDLPETTKVHIISSNTHSVTNCLNPFFADRSADIRAWAESTGHWSAINKWREPTDLLYAAGRDYVTSSAGIQAEFRHDSELSAVRLGETVSTGIEVQIIDVSRLAGRDIDPLLPRLSETGDVLVNIDYAFGEQAGEIVRNLIMLFGRRLASINVLGKAGALTGRRGDILAPTAFIEQSSDRFYPFDARVNSDMERLTRLAGDRGVHVGPLLTVSGTLLQNSTMLHFYRHIWDCIGLEMEGAYYYRQILESQQLDVLDERIPLRFLYYVSDLPLDRNEDLSANLGPEDGLPPLYAITRQVLSEIFNEARQPA